MKVSALRILALGALVAAIGTAPASSSNSELSQIAGYRQWTRLTESPRLVTVDGLGG